jgi:hypothetical protein
MEVSDQLHAPAALLLVEGRALLDRRLDEPQSRYERIGEHKNLLSPPRIEAYISATAYINMLDLFSSCQNL